MYNSQIRHLVHSPGSQSSCIYHFIRIHVFTLIICHFSQPFISDLKPSVSQILSSVVFLVPLGLLSRILDLDRAYWALAFVLVPSFYIFIGYVAQTKSTTLSAFQCAINSCTVSYRTDNLHNNTVQYCTHNQTFAMALPCHLLSVNVWFVLLTSHNFVIFTFTFLN